MGWKTWPDVWHLDDEGVVQCYFRASSIDSIRRWAQDPSRLRRSRLAGLAEGGCADRWLIVETRHAFRTDLRVDERDAKAFLVLRRELTRIGLVLVDTMIFDDNLHWWSMHELTSGTTRWP